MTDLEQNYTRCFSTPAGAAVLEHLRTITILRPTCASTSDNELRWGAAQSALVRQIESMIARGRGTKS